jgi:hypothetical protein
MAGPIDYKAFYSIELHLMALHDTTEARARAETETYQHTRVMDDDSSRDNRRTVVDYCRVEQMKAGSTYLRSVLLDLVAGLGSTSGACCTSPVSQPHALSVVRRSPCSHHAR